MENKKQKEKVEMSIRGTIIGEITKKAKINWDNMSEKEADEEIEKIKDYNSDYYYYYYEDESDNYDYYNEY